MWNDEPARRNARGLAIARDSLAPKQRSHNLSAQLSPGVRCEAMAVVQAIHVDFVCRGKIDHGEISFRAYGNTPERPGKPKSLGDIRGQQAREQWPIWIRALQP